MRHKNRRVAIKTVTILILSALIIAPSAFALEPNYDDVYIRVIDVGPGLCCVVKIPGNHYMVYDAGLREMAMDDIREIIPEGHIIDLLVLSHSDVDHIGAVDEICAEYQVERVLRTGDERTTKAWLAADSAITEEIDQSGCLDIKLSEVEFPHGATYRFGEAFVTFVCGFDQPLSEWNLTDPNLKKNAISIVVRLQYRDRSVLFCGDAVGRLMDDDDEVCIATERYILDMSPVILIESDVLVAPNHGADNANSKPFIEAVAPEFVIFSAGHKHRYPTEAAALRYISAEVDTLKMFRTDKGDNEGSKEWDYMRGTSDPTGDDDVDILLKADRTVEVEYREP